MRLPYALRFARLGITSLLGALGVAIGAANIIALISVTQTGRWQALGVLRDAGSDTLFVLPFSQGADMQEAAGARSWLPASFEGALRRVPELDGVAAVLMMPGHVGAGAQRMFVTVQGVNRDYLRVRNHAVAQGEFFSEEQLRSHARVVALGHAMPEKLFGRRDVVGESVVIKGERYEVVAVMVKKGMIGFEDFDQRAFIPLGTAQEIYELDGLHSILAQAKKGIGPEAARTSVEAALRKAQGLGPDDATDFSVSTVDELTGIIDHMTRVFRYLLYGIGSVALLVAGIGIMNVMLMQVIERTREIGVRRAAGARRRDILLQFLSDAIVQVVIGVIAGVGLGVFGSWLFCTLVDWQLHLSWDVVLLAVGFSLLVGVVFGIYPAIQAARLKPIDALRYE
jgi:putative ABC transport system permease protein